MDTNILNGSHLYKPTHPPTRSLTHTYIHACTLTQTYTKTYPHIPTLYKHTDIDTNTEIYKDKDTHTQTMLKKTGMQDNKHSV